MASDALQNLATSIERLPAAALHSVDGAQLASMLSALASDLPALPQDILEEAMADIDTSASLLTMLPMDELEWTSRESLGELIRFATYRYDILTFWSPEVWSAFFLHLLAVLVRFSKGYLLRLAVKRRVRGQIDAAQASERPDEKKGAPKAFSVDRAMAELDSKTRSIISHSINFVVACTVLGLQLTAWRAFSFASDRPFILRDVEYILLALKLLMLTYAAELFYAPVHMHIVVHHLNTGAIVYSTLIVAHFTHDPRIYRFGTWFLLQASTEQASYLAMIAYHSYSYLTLQDRPRPARHSLRLAARTMHVVKGTAPIQKFAPIAAGCFWLADAWAHSASSPAGRFWLVFVIICVVVQVALVSAFIDQNFAIAPAMQAKLAGTTCTERRGPLAGAVHRLRRANTPPSPPNESNTTSRDSKRFSLDAMLGLRSARPSIDVVRLPEPVLDRFTPLEAIIVLSESPTRRLVKGKARQIGLRLSSGWRSTSSSASNSPLTPRAMLGGIVESKEEVSEGQAV